MTTYDVGSYAAEAAAAAKELQSARQSAGIDQSTIKLMQELAALRKQIAPVLQAREEIRKAQARQEKFFTPDLAILRCRGSRCCCHRHVT